MPVTLEKIPGKEDRVILSMGPQHPSTHGVLRLVLELEGETVVRAIYDIGYLHTGFEKSFESKTYSQGITLTDRMDYLAPLSNNLGFCLAIEKLLDLEIPPRAQWIRVLLTELTRIQSHLVWLGTHAIDLGAMSVFLYCFREREEILHIFEAVSGQRMMTSYFRIGGLALEPPLGWLKRVREVRSRAFPRASTSTKTLLTRNPIWLRRTAGRGLHFRRGRHCLRAFRARRCAAPASIGTFARSSPIRVTRSLISRSPTRPEGDVYGRYLVRVEEMRQSLRIVNQAMEGLPEGPVKANAPHIVHARPREHEDLHRGADLSLQDCDGGIPPARRRSLPGHRIAARRTGLLHGQRWLAQALPLPCPRALVRELAGIAEIDRRPIDRRRRGVHRDDRYCFGRSGSMRRRGKG